MPAEKYYNAAGERLSGVTTVIKNIGWGAEGLMWWANRIGQEEGRSHRDASEEAATLGDFGHLAMEADVKGEPFDINKLDLAPQQKIQLYTCLGAWETWKAQTKLELIDAEIKMVSERLQVGGKLDILVKACGKLAILDLKTGNKVYESAIIQVATYADMWNELHPDNPVECIYILRVDKTYGSFGYRYWPLEALEAARKAFFHARQLHDLKKKCKDLVG